MTKYVVTASALHVRSMPSTQGEVLGSVRRNEVVDWLETSADEKWSRIKKDALTGWSSNAYLSLQTSGGGIDQIIQVAAASQIASYRWRDRGTAPRGYIKGMTLVYARVYCKLKAGDAAATEMAKAVTDNSDKDALAHYSQEFSNAGMSNRAGVDTLRHLFVLLIGLGVRESSGKYCEGRDRTVPNSTPDTAEAGLFQTSYNARNANRLMPQLISKYSTNPDGFVEVFREGVTYHDSELENIGPGEGEKFQRLSKACPAFAAEFAAVGLRNLRRHWGPINRKEVELRPECDALLKQVENIVDEQNLCPFLT